MTAAIAVSRLLPDIFEFRFDPGDKIFRCLGPAKKASDLFALAVQDQEGGISGHPVGLSHRYTFALFGIVLRIDECFVEIVARRSLRKHVMYLHGPHQVA